MNLDETGTLAHELGRVLTEICSPDETDIYDDLVRAQRGPGRLRDHPLAYGGLEKVVDALSPQLIMLAQTTVTFIGLLVVGSLKELSETAAKETTTALKKRIADWIQRKLASPPPISLDETKRLELGEKLKAEARKAGLDEATTKIVVDRIVSSLK